MELNEWRLLFRARSGEVASGSPLEGAQLISGARFDAPQDASILIITDGYCDTLTVLRDHAYLMPQGARLPAPATRTTGFRITANSGSNAAISKMRDF